jgi:uncharacterized C2H2 Zn-finger protein
VKYAFLLTQKPLQCHRCTSPFVGINDLKRHVGTFHEGGKCEICGFIFRINYKDSTHVESIHKNLKS